MEALRTLADLIARYAPADGSFNTAIARVGLIRSGSVTEPLHTLYEPSCCIVAQGRKRATLADTAYVYDPSHYLVVGADLPVIGAVIEASKTEPYLCFRLEVDRNVLAEMLIEQPQPADEMAAVGVSAATPELIDAAVRMLQLLDAPNDAPALAPLVEREILHRLIRGPQGNILRQIASGGSRLNQIRRTIEFIRQNFQQAFSIEDLADMAGMSASSFHEHFRAITATSPLQFRTQIRLQEARRLMLVEGLNAADAGFRTGYESPSQFSREYTRVFQISPRRDVVRMKAVGV